MAKIYEVFMGIGSNGDYRIVDIELTKFTSIPEVLKRFDDLPRSIGDWGESVTVDEFCLVRHFMTAKGIEECGLPISSGAYSRFWNSIFVPIRHPRLSKEEV